MKNQPRDKNGRFVGKKEKIENRLFLGFLLISLIGFAFIGGDIFGYNRGYQTGLSNNQPTIYQNGFDAGATQQKNIDELARNWTALEWRTAKDGSVNKVYYKNDNLYQIRIVGADQNTKFEYIKPTWANMPPPQYVESDCCQFNECFMRYYK